jgi:hypothetical protein
VKSGSDKFIVFYAWQSDLRKCPALHLIRARENIRDWLAPLEPAVRFLGRRRNSCVLGPG